MHGIFRKRMASCDREFRMPGINRALLSLYKIIMIILGRCQLICCANHNFCSFHNFAQYLSVVLHFLFKIWKSHSLPRWRRSNAGMIALQFSHHCLPFAWHTGSMRTAHYIQIKWNRCYYYRNLRRANTFKFIGFEIGEEWKLNGVMNS